MAVRVALNLASRKRCDLKRKRGSPAISIPHPKIRAARLENETAPEDALTRHEKRFEKREKRSEKRFETRPKNV